MKMITLLVVGVVGIILGSILTCSIQSVRAEDTSDPNSINASLITVPSEIINFDQIYHTELVEPFQQAGLEITDPQIKNYYYKLMNDTGIIPYAAPNQALNP
jgi:hypothetical protein